MSEQLSLNFSEAPRSASGLTVWREMRRAELDVVAFSKGLPIGRPARVRLASGVLAEGKLVLANEELWIGQPLAGDVRLRIGNIDFSIAEIESCVRIA